MKTTTKNLCFLPALIAALGLMMPTGRVTAQTFTVLHSFAELHIGIALFNDDGVRPNGLILSGNALYGTANSGGALGNSTLFILNKDGTGFGTLNVFDSSSNIRNPSGSLILSGDILYGTSSIWGAETAVFAGNMGGTGVTGFTNIIHNFNDARPVGGLVLSPHRRVTRQPANSTLPRHSRPTQEKPICPKQTETNQSRQFA